MQLRKIILIIFAICLAGAELNAQPGRLSKDVFLKCISDMGIKRTLPLEIQNDTIHFTGMVEDPDKASAIGLEKIWRGDAANIKALPDGNIQIMLERKLYPKLLLGPENRGWWPFMAERLGFEPDSGYLVGSNEEIITGKVVAPDILNQLGVRASLNDRIELCMFDGFFKFEYWKDHYFRGNKMAFHVFGPAKRGIFKDFDMNGSMYNFGKFLLENGVIPDRKQAARFFPLSTRPVYGEISDPELAAEIGIENVSEGERIIFFPKKEIWEWISCKPKTYSAIQFVINEDSSVKIIRNRN